MLRLALKMLLGDRAKYTGLLFGITFTSFLVTFAASYLCGFLTRGFALIAGTQPGFSAAAVNYGEVPAERWGVVIGTYDYSGSGSGPDRYRSTTM